MLALLRFVENPRDRGAGFRLLHLLPGIGSATAQRALDRMAEAADPIAAIASIPTPPRAGDDWKGFVETLSNLRYSEWPVDLERARLWHEPHPSANSRSPVELSDFGHSHRKIARKNPHKAFHCTVQIEMIARKHSNGRRLTHVLPSTQIL